MYFAVFYLNKFLCIRITCIVIQVSLSAQWQKYLNNVFLEFVTVKNEFDLVEKSVNRFPNYLVLDVFFEV